MTELTSDVRIEKNSAYSFRFTFDNLILTIVNKTIRFHFFNSYRLFHIQWLRVREANGVLIYPVDSTIQLL